MENKFSLHLSSYVFRVAEVLDYAPDELVGESLYSLCHAEDAVMLKKAHSDGELG